MRTKEQTVEFYENAAKAFDLSQMPLYKIAEIIQSDWKKVYFGAAPYLAAMKTLDSIKDNFILDSGHSVVAYFLSNAASWKGQVAREVKKELNRRLKS